MRVCPDIVGNLPASWFPSVGSEVIGRSKFESGRCLGYAVAVWDDWSTGSVLVHEKCNLYGEPAPDYVRVEVYY